VDSGWAAVRWLGFRLGLGFSFYLFFSFSVFNSENFEKGVFESLEKEKNMRCLKLHNHTWFAWEKGEKKTKRGIEVEIGVQHFMCNKNNLVKFYKINPTI
jgi:hypothetical protein